MLNTTTHAATRAQSELQLIAGLARIAAEALQATPSGELPPATVGHALALIQERADIAAGE